MNTAIDPAQRLARWRLILGAQAQERLERMGACGLTEEQLLMDQALGAIYGDDAGADALGGRGAGSGPSSPRISKWLGDVRALFDREIVTVIQSDAIERRGLRQLLFEPELLQNLEPDIGLASRKGQKKACAHSSKKSWKKSTACWKTISAAL